ncbi:hypothetical protein D3C85_1030870 [compost metagenome]
MFKSPNPNFIFSWQQTMYIIIGHRTFTSGWFIRSKHLRFRIELIHPSIFCSYPKITILIFVNFSDCAAANRILIVFRKKFFKLIVLFLMVIDTSKISSNPNSILFINSNRIGSIIRNTKRVIKILF